MRGFWRRAAAALTEALDWSQVSCAEHILAVAHREHTVNAVIIQLPRPAGHVLGRGKTWAISAADGGVVIDFVALKDRKMAGNHDRLGI